MNMSIEIPRAVDFVTVVLPDGTKLDIFSTGTVQVYLPGKAYEIQIGRLFVEHETGTVSCPVSRIG